MLRLFAFGILFPLIPSMANAAALKTGSVGNWSVGAYSNDETGNFSHCAASASYRSGISLAFAINKRYEWSVGFANASWHLKPGTRYPVSLQVDSGIVMNEMAVGILPTLAQVQLADSRGLFDAFKYGNNLTVQVAGHTFRFRLTDTSSLLPTLLACVKTYEERPPKTINEGPTNVETPPTMP